jgi:hypothetical protein
MRAQNGQLAHLGAKGGVLGFQFASAGFTRQCYTCWASQAEQFPSVLEGDIQKPKAMT